MKMRRMSHGLKGIQAQQITIIAGIINKTIQNAVLSGTQEGEKDKIFNMRKNHVAASFNILKTGTILAPAQLEHKLYKI